MPRHPDDPRDESPDERPGDAGSPDGEPAGRAGPTSNDLSLATIHVDGPAPDTLIPGALDEPEAPLVPSGTRAEQTIRPTPDTLDDEEEQLDQLARRAARLDREVELGRVLGRGGMGVVRAATQRSLERPVAVKSVNPRARATSARRSLLREASAAAAVEHPNIVPVYTLATDADGEPHIVMRRIAGRTWLEYFADGDAVKRHFGVRDLLAWHLGVLMSVCNAIHYAHSRRVLHRDLKPENVMIGHFGEVWVLDWGLAVRLDGPPDLSHARDTFDPDDAVGPSLLPLARDQRRVVGTPRYMAPEMATGDGRALSERTDVYLLGSLLHVILTGRAPHPGGDARETLRRIPTFTPRLRPGTPARLVDILRRAMAADPAERHPSAEALRLDLQGYLEERSADRLAVEALTQLQKLRRDLEQDVTAGGEGEGEVRQRLYRHFGACRFGFQQALEAFPDHAEAAAGLREALVSMARWELDAGAPAAARLHLAQLEDPPAELLARCDALEADQARLREEAAALRQEHDPRVGKRTRVFVFGLVMLAWTVIPALTWLLDVPVTWEGSVALHGTTFVLVAGLVVWARDSLGKTSLNRQVAHMLVTIQTFVVLSLVVGHALGLGPLEVLVIDDLFFGCLSGFMVSSLGRLAVPPAVAYCLTAIVGTVAPDLLLPLNAACNAGVAALIYYVWGRDEPLLRQGDPDDTARGSRGFTGR